MENTNQTQEPSDAELRALFTSAKDEAEAPVVVPAAAEAPKGEEEAGNIEPPPSGDGEVKLTEEKEDELPPGVVKRIAKEAERAARIQAEIDKAVSSRKAKEAELKRISEPGSDPVKTDANAPQRPVRPDIATFPGTLADYNEAVKKYDDELSAYTEHVSREAVRREMTEQQKRQETEAQWKAAVAKHGQDFEGLMSRLASATTPQFQQAVSNLEDWSSVAVHLAKNEAELQALQTQFSANPYAAIAALGRLEYRLKPGADASEKPAPQVPKVKPLKEVAGGPSGTSAPIDLDKADFGTFKKQVRLMLHPN
jgi:hypothetical protein